MRNSSIKCQVLCCTYNHKNYIKDALNGFIMQKTDFPFEVLVADDCSTDGTSEIIEEYAQKYPNIIKHIRREKNLGAQENSYDILQKIDADYLALCEGDDYWTDSKKLQKQIDFLEKNKHLNGCFHNAEIKKESQVKYWNFDEYYPADENGKQYWPNSIKGFNFNKKAFTLSDIIGGIIPTASVVYRYDRTIKYPEWFRNCIAGDRPMHCFMIKSGAFGYINETMSVYRVSKDGTWFNKKADKPEDVYEWIKLLNNIDNYFENKYSDIFEKHKRANFNRAMSTAIKNKDGNAVSELTKILPEYFFNYLDLRETKYYKVIYKFAGIPVWKIVNRGNIKAYYLFGILKLMESKQY